MSQPYKGARATVTHAEEFSGYIQEVPFLLAAGLDDTGQKRVCVSTRVTAVSG